MTINYIGPGYNPREASGRLPATLRGFAYPLQLNGKGGIATVEDFDVIRGQIMSVLETRPFERVMRQHYGVPDTVLSAYDPAGLSAQIRLALEGEIPDVNFNVYSEVEYAEQGVMRVIVEWSLRNVPQPSIEFRLSR